jgi:hypothetical protein
MPLKLTRKIVKKEEGKKIDQRFKIKLKWRQAHLYADIITW